MQHNTIAHKIPVYDIDLTMLVHVQKYFNYASESQIYGKNKHLIHQHLNRDKSSNIQLALTNRPVIFEDVPIWKSDEAGRFNPKMIDTYIQSKNIPPDSVASLTIKMVGGELERCVLYTFACIKVWEKQTSQLNRLKIIMPANAMFGYNSGGSSPKRRAYTLKERIDDESVMMSIGFYALEEFTGQIHINDDTVEFMSKKDPWGVFFKGEKIRVLSDYKYDMMHLR